MVTHPNLQAFSTIDEVSTSCTRIASLTCISKESSSCLWRIQNVWLSYSCNLGQVSHWISLTQRVGFKLPIVLQTRLLKVLTIATSGKPANQNLPPDHWSPSGCLSISISRLLRASFIPIQTGWEVIYKRRINSKSNLHCNVCICFTSTCCSQCFLLHP